ncbi:MAG: aminotransferase class IV [Caulobacterales bacterium]|nr:aminotransferase class IV [Caulobacterales bacterium]
MMPLDDRGLLLGDGLFETILARDGELILFEQHIERLQASCMALGLSAPYLNDTRALCQSMLDDFEPGAARAAVRLTMTAGSGGRGLERPAETEPHIFASVTPSPRPIGAVNLVTSEVRRNEGSPASRLKTLSYIDNVLARYAASPAEALLLNNRQEIACAASANIFWVRGGKLFTPHLDCGVLNGIMRQQVLAMAEVEEVRAPRAMLEGADAVFLTNSLVGVRPVATLDGAPLRTHPFVERLITALADVS